MPVISPIKPKAAVVRARCPKHLRSDVQKGLTVFQKEYSPQSKIIFDVVDSSNGDIGVSARKIGFISFLKSKLKKEKPQYIIPKKESNEDIRPSFMVAFENAYIACYSDNKMFI